MKYHILHIKDRKYIYFPFSQIFFRYSEELKNILDNDQLQNESIKKIIEKEKKSEEVVEEIIKNDAKVEHRIAGAEINIVHGCNMKCRYCFAEGGNHGKTGKMSKGTPKKVIDFILSKASKSNLEIQIVGGEPFVDFEIFKEVVSQRQTRKIPFDTKIHFSTVSNGLNINKETIDFLKENEIYLNISLDSQDKKINDFLRPTRSGVSAYKHIMENLSLFSKMDGFSVNVTITPYNLQIFRIAKFLFENKNVKNIHFSEVVSDQKDMLFTEKDIDELLIEYEKIADLIIRKIKKKEYVGCYPLTTFMEKIHNNIPTIRPCSVLKNRCAFSPTGEIYPCDMMMYDEYRIGDIKNGFDNAAISKMRTIMQDESQCQECWARYLCGGECLSTKQWSNIEQKKLRCKIKQHICKLRLYIYDSIASEIADIKKDIGEC